MSPKEKELLHSPAAPIVLLAALPQTRLGRQVAPGQNRLGFMLPYSPLHRLLIEKMGEPLVMTSANRSDEPIVFQDEVAELRELSDAITHDRPIHVFCRRFGCGRLRQRNGFFRRSRGFVPLPIRLPISSPQTVLALGGMLKTTFTVLDRDRALVSQHIGDTESLAALGAEKAAIAHFFEDIRPAPRSHRRGQPSRLPQPPAGRRFPGCRVIEVQHHRAHIASLLAESGETGKVLGMAIDGTGYGDDGTIWGGEFFLGDCTAWSVGHLLPIFLPGGDAAAREPWRTALSLLLAVSAEKAARRFAKKFGRKGDQVFEAIVQRRGGVMTSSCGRLFDGVAALLGLGDCNSYEGELPSLLQAEAERARPQKQSYPYALVKKAPYRS